MKWYYNMKIGVKLVIAFLVVACIAGIIGVIGVINIKNIDELDTKLYEQMTVPLGEMIIVAEAYQKMRGNVKDIILAADNNEITEYENRIKDRNNEFAGNMERIEKTLMTDEGRKLYNDVIENKKHYDSVAADIINYIKTNNRDNAMALLRGEGYTVSLALEDAIKKLSDSKVTIAKQTSDTNSATAISAITQTIVIIIAGMVISVLFGVFISSSIRKPLNKIVAVSEKIAGGDLDVVIDVYTNDEIGVLANAFRKMSDNINEVLTNINNAAEQVAAGAKQVSDSSTELSQGATEQASSIEQLTASLEEISSQTKQNAQNANQANELAVAAKNNAVQGNEQMGGMLKAMEEINDSSANISKIIKVIDEIAFQTNILALNAAVEAARAGQHGKGFAVVAEEVRNLAARSANAAKETTDLIEGSIKKTENGTKIANETAAALNKIVDGVAKAASLVGDIAVASNEQATGIAQVNQGIMQVSQVVQTNSSTSEESAAASEELSSQAELMRDLVGKFKLKKIKHNYNKFDTLNPDVLKMLEDMSEKKKANKIHLNKAREESVTDRSRIALSDKEFGKY